MTVDSRSVYIAGMITKDPNYRQKFAAAAAELEKAGFLVMNPAILPKGFSYEAYMMISGKMLDACASLCLLPDWIYSNGANQELRRASADAKRIFHYLSWVEGGKPDAETVIAAPAAAN